MCNQYVWFSPLLLLLLSVSVWLTCTTQLLQVKLVLQKLSKMKTIWGTWADTQCWFTRSTCAFQQVNCIAPSTVANDLQKSIYQHMADTTLIQVLAQTSCTHHQHAPNTIYICTNTEVAYRSPSQGWKIVFRFLKVF